jgi:hypothetical protein
MRSLESVTSIEPDRTARILQTAAFWSADLQLTDHDDVLSGQMMHFLWSEYVFFGHREFDPHGVYVQPCCPRLLSDRCDVDETASQATQLPFPSLRGRDKILVRMFLYRTTRNSLPRGSLTIKPVAADT